MDELIKPVGMVIGHTLQSLVKLVKLKLYKHSGEKLTFDQFGLLFAIYQHDEELIQKDMADMMCKDKSAILRMIDSLEEKEMLRRVASENDRRKNQIELTGKGLNAINYVLEIEKSVQEIVFDGLKENEIKTFYKVLEHVRCKSEQC
jgi:DNA-binding MarR family transcriptional regulator